MGFIKNIYWVVILCLETVMSASRKPRLTLSEPMPSYYYTDIKGDSGAYSFGYDVWDPATGNKQFRNEERYPNGTVAGRYGYIDALGKARVYNYVADNRGYRVSSEEKITPERISVNANPIDTTTETSVTWTRPSKKKPQTSKGNLLQRRTYNHVQPPGYYILY